MRLALRPGVLLLVVAGAVALGAAAAAPGDAGDPVRALALAAAVLAALAPPTLVLVLSLCGGGRAAPWIGALACLLLAAALDRLLPREGLSGPALGLVRLLGAGWLVLSAGLWLGGRLARGAGLAALAPLLVSAAFLAAPFALDAWAARARDPGQSRAVISWARTLSPATVAAEAGGGLDLFKQERFYRRFRLGEEFWAPPKGIEARRVLARRAAGLWSLIGVLAALGGGALGWFRRR